jgi:hypothetical protein
MEEFQNKAGNLTDHVGEYIETYSKLIALNATERATGIASVSITSLVLAALTTFVLLFASLCLGWWAGERLDNMPAGFGIVTGIYLVAVILILLFRKKIIPYIQDRLIQKVYEDEDHNVAQGSVGSETRITEAA